MNISGVTTSGGRMAATTPPSGHSQLPAITTASDVRSLARMLPTRAVATNTDG